MTPKRRRGIGAVAHCLSRDIHPSAPIRAKNPNREKGHTLTNLFITRQADKTVHRGTDPKPCYLFTTEEYPDQAFFAMARYVHVDTKGPAIHLFTPAVPVIPPMQPAEEEDSSDRMVEGEEGRVEGFQNGPLLPEHLVELRNAGIKVDDDNKPAPENIPGRMAPLTVPVNWRSDGLICPRRSSNVTNAKSAFKLFSNAEFSSLTRLKKFLVLFPIIYLEDVLILGVSSRRDWRSLSPVSPHRGAPFRLNKYMSRTRFEAILRNLKYINKTVPYRDGFLQMRQMAEYWNQNMADFFSPSWISMLNESMMEWTNKYAPGFMCVGRKPHPF